MMMRFLTSAALLGMLLCPIARAEGKPATKDETSKPKTAAEKRVEETLKAILDKYDKDRDGTLSDEERKALREDRALERAKTAPTRKKSPRRKTQRRNPLAQRVLAKFDKNKNGKLDPDERRKYQQEYNKNRQKALSNLRKRLGRGNRTSRGGKRGSSRRRPTNRNRNRGRRRTTNNRNNPLKRLQELRRRAQQQQQKRRRKRR